MVVLALLVAACLSALFAATYVLSLGNPKPRDIPIAVVGVGAAAERAAAALERSGASRRKSCRPLPRPARRSKIGRSYAALVPAEGRLIVSQAAGFATHALISTAIPAAAEAGQTLSVETVHPLPEDDPRGAVMSFYVLALVVGGYIGATVLTALAGARRPAFATAGVRVVALVLYAIVAGSLTTIVTGSAWGISQGTASSSPDWRSSSSSRSPPSSPRFDRDRDPRLARRHGRARLARLPGLERGGLGASSLRHPHHGALSPGPAGVDTALRSPCTSTAPRVTRNLLVLTAYAVVGTVVVLLTGRRRGRALNAEAQAAAAASR